MTKTRPFCQATTVRGSSCRNRAQVGDRYCRLHGRTVCRDLRSWGDIGHGLVPARRRVQVMDLLRPEPDIDEDPDWPMCGSTIHEQFGRLPFTAQVIGALEAIEMLPPSENPECARRADHAVQDIHEWLLGGGEPPNRSHQDDGLRETAVHQLASRVPMFPPLADLVCHVVMETHDHQPTNSAPDAGFFRGVYIRNPAITSWAANRVIRQWWSRCRGRLAIANIEGVSFPVDESWVTTPGAREFLRDFHLSGPLGNGWELAIQAQLRARLREQIADDVVTHEHRARHLTPVAWRPSTNDVVVLSTADDTYARLVGFRIGTGTMRKYHGFSNWYFGEDGPYVQEWEYEDWYDDE